jgi:tetratricopeptide (TPR) repeat protein
VAVKTSPGLILTLTLSIFLGSCAIMKDANIDELEKSDHLEIRSNAFLELRRHPRAFRKHFETALTFLKKKDREQVDLQYARVGFETSWRLSRDFWPALLYLGIANDALGEYEKAIDSFVRAAVIYDHAAIWRAASLSALKLGYERSAFVLYNKSLGAAWKNTDEIKNYLDQLYEKQSSAAKNARSVLVSRLDYLNENKSFECFNFEKDDGESSISEDTNSLETSENSETNAELSDIDLSGIKFDFSGLDSSATEETKPDQTSPNLELVEQSSKLYDGLEKNCLLKNVFIDTFIIRRTASSQNQTGIDLLSALQLTAGAVLLNFERIETNDVAGVGVNVQKTGRSGVNLTIPDITYALSLASENVEFLSVEASPTIMMRVGQTSEIFDGTEVVIIATGNDSSGQFQKEIGVKMKSHLYYIDENAATIKLDLSLSNLDGSSGSANFTVINTNKLESTVNGTFSYNTPLVFGGIAAQSVQADAVGQTGLKDIPGLGLLFGVDRKANLNRDITVIASVRPAEPENTSAAIRDMKFIQQIGFQPPETDFYRSGFIYESPGLKSIEKIIPANMQNF